jgi:hypothetical protein
MATTLTQLSQFLDERGWRYEVDRENQAIYACVKAESVEKLVLKLQLSENGEFLQFQALQLFFLTNQLYKNPTLQTMATIQYQVKMIRLEYDPRDGEVRASIELPLEDAPLTLRQFNRALNGLVQLLDSHAMPRLKQTLATGVDPGAPSLARQLVEALPTDVLSALAQAIQDKR